MDHKSFKSFSSKILLFGEYLVLQGGKSISFPYRPYSLKRSEVYSPKSKYFFRKLLDYIECHDDLRDKVSEEFSREVSLGLNFESNIPVGYGLGSSGALVASLYDNFFTDKAIEYRALKKDLADLESFFHDKSSGIDPLTSYLDRGILSGPQGIETLSNGSLGPFSLYDSGIKRSAREAIQHFNQLIECSEFKGGLSQLAELSDTMINKWLKMEAINDEMRQYSIIQLRYFKDFIPDSVETEWRNGLDTNEFYLKLCGAGMGGMYLKSQLAIDGK